MKTNNGYLSLLAGIVGLSLLSSPAECRHVGAHRKRTLAQRVELLDPLGIAREVAARQVFGEERPPSAQEEAQPSTAESSGGERALKLCLSRCAGTVDDVALRRAWIAPGGGIDLDDAALAARTRKMGMGLNWAAMPNLKFSADYERAMDTVDVGRVAPEVVRARMQWNF